MAVEELVGHIPDGWTYTTLGKACADGGGDIQAGPFGSQFHAADYVPVGVPSIMPQNIGDNRISEYGIARITPEDATRLSRYLVREGDIVYSRPGDVEKRALIRANEDGWLCGTGCLRVRLGDKGANSSYAAYYLGHPSVREWIVRHAHGATMPNLNTSILSSCPFVIPPPAEQHAIAHILGTLDDKIELNRRRNQTLEAMARALFKDWFVDFGPVRAKMEGHDPYLPADLWQLFPDRLDDEGKPEGWEIVSASKFIEFNPTEPLRKGTPAPYLDMASLPTSGSWPEPPIMRDFRSGMRFRNGDTLLARITPCLENGKTAFVQCLPDDTVGWGSTEYIIMRPKAPVPAAYAYLLARDDAFREHAIRSMTGTSGRQRAQGDSVAAFKLASPWDEDLWHAFERQVSPTFESIKSNAKASETLSALRDTLLPKLISGELRIKDAEKFMESVG
ncbi:type I restriction-modification system specificity determinant XF2741 [Methylocaldum marinum]|uniref:Type I restriction-modification system specificity determinant XF2741 n=1 Tax=Methylocaldum marinum TaxID=1432792 RepID=A0A250KV81_9GAMM|nr:restriction endonuclease subunit S [Methylocaldum marinum]BBA33689.1 type I restriction-modification system specificity determinant XF2741 [Methylocaldum marinum]